MRMRFVSSSLSLLAAGAMLAAASCDGGANDKPVTTGGAGSTASGAAGTSAGAAGTTGANAGTDGSGAAGTTPGSGETGTGANPSGGGGSSAAGTTGSTGTDAGTTPPGDGGAAPTPKGMSEGCTKPPGAGDKPGSFIQRKIMVTGVAADVKAATAGGSWTDRVYYLDLPSGYDPTKAYPIIFGGGGCGGSLIQNGNGGGFAVLPAGNKDAIQIGLSYVWPQGGGACFSENGANTPDLPYFDSVLKEVEANYCVDKGKVFVGGYSSGGWLSYMLGLARGGVVRGISPAAGGLHPMASRPPDSKLPIAALLLTGADDGANPATGPTGSDAARDLILQINGCQGVETTPWPTCVNCACVKYNGCPAAYPVIRCRPPGQGHTDGGGAFKTAIWSVWSTLP